MVRDAELTLDELGDAGTGPDISAEAEGRCTAGQAGREGSQLVRAEAWGSTGRRAGAQGFHAAVARTSQPLADGTLGDTERLSNLTLFPVLLVQLPSTKATALAPIP